LSFKGPWQTVVPASIEKRISQIYEGLDKGYCAAKNNIGAKPGVVPIESAFFHNLACCLERFR